MQEIRGDSHANGLADLETLATELGCELQIADTGRADGIYHRDSRRIEISDRLEPNGQLAAGIHEIGHALVALDELAPKLTYAEEELIVESVAFCCCQTVGTPAPTASRISPPGQSARRSRCSSRPRR
jgi:hypothetical protein